MRRRLALVALPLVLAACTGSGGGTVTTGTTRVATRDEAGLLASALRVNYDAQGAAFDVRFRSAGADVVLTGAVDWLNHTGKANVRLGQAPPYQVAWTDDAVFTALPGLVERVPGITWLVRPPDRTANRIDAIIAVLTGSASPTVDNPVALQQRSDVRVLATGQVDGAPTTTFKSGDLVLEVGTTDGRLRRLDAPLSFAEGPAVFTYTDPGPLVVPLPGRDETADTSAHADVAAQLSRVGIL